MKLYYAPHMASLAALIVAIEIGQTMDLVKVDMETRLLPSGASLSSVTPKNLLPVVEMEDGGILTETAAILVYLASMSNGEQLIPPFGSPAFHRTMEWLSFFSTELHKFFTLLFWADCLEVREPACARIISKFEVLESMVGHGYLVDDRYSIADIYLYINARALHLVGRVITDYPKVAVLVARVEARAAVVRARAVHV